MKKQNMRDRDLLELADCIGELIDKVEADTEFTYDVGWDGRRAEKVLERTYRVTEVGLLQQLVRGLQPGTASTGEPVTRARPAPSTPSAAYVSGVLMRIAREAAALRHDMRRAAQDKAPSLQERRTVRSDLLEIRSLAFAVPDTVVREAARRARAWVSLARVALTWDAPVVTLSEASCPYCGGQLQVRSDAGSDVWCAGSPAGRGTERQPPCRDEDGRQRRWPRSNWIMLLERMAETGQQAVRAG